MLILQRKAGESIFIGDSISVTVVSAEEGRVKLAVEAPKDVPILRSELRAAIESNRDAAREEAPPAELLHMLDARC